MALPITGPDLLDPALFLPGDPPPGLRLGKLARRFPANHIFQK